MLTETMSSPPGLTDAEVEDAAGDVDAGGRDAVLELHRVVDLVHGVALGGLHDVEGEDAAAHGLRGAEADLVEFRRNGVRRGLAAAGRVRDPMGARSADRRDGLVAHHEGTDVAVARVA